MGHVSKTTPLLGVICHPFGKTWHSLPLYKIWDYLTALALAIPEIWMGPQNLQEALQSQRNRATRLSVEIMQLQNIAIVWHYLRDPTFSSFYTIPKCNRQTHTDRPTDRYMTTTCTALSIASRGKNHPDFAAIFGDVTLTNWTGIAAYSGWV